MRSPRRFRWRAAARSDREPNQRRHHGLPVGEGLTRRALPLRERSNGGLARLPGVLLGPPATAARAGIKTLGPAFAQPGGLADAVAQVVQLGPADPAGALDLDLGNLRRVEGEDALDPLALDNAADRKHLARPA